jgi:hypothetical protein
MRQLHDLQDKLRKRVQEGSDPRPLSELWWVFKRAQQS